MTLPPKITNVKAENNVSRHGQKILCIIAHDTERPNDNASSLNTLKTGDGRQVSIHILINEDGSCYRMIDDSLGANHAGYGTITLNGVKYSKDSQYSVNTISLGFELERTVNATKPYPKAQMLTMGYWINYWRDHFGALPIYRHGDVDPTRRSDPKRLTIPEMEQWAILAHNAMSDIPTPETPHTYVMQIPQVVYTAPDLTSRFAGTETNPLIMSATAKVDIGKIMDNGWLWLSVGWGFIPPNTARKVTL